MNVSVEGNTRKDMIKTRAGREKEGDVMSSKPFPRRVKVKKINNLG